MEPESTVTTVDKQISAAVIFRKPEFQAEPGQVKWWNKMWESSMQSKKKTICFGFCKPDETSFEISKMLLQKWKDGKQRQKCEGDQR